MNSRRGLAPASRLLALAAGLTGCAASPHPEQAEPVAPLRVQGEGYEGVILPADAEDRDVTGTVDTWVPTAEQVRAAEGLLAAYVRKEAAGYAPDLWKRLPGYYRQYLGTIHDGRRCIYINLVLRTCWDEMAVDGLDGDRRLVWVFDGGDAFVQATFDVEASEFLELAINGDA